MKKKSARNSKPTPEYDSERETRVLLEEVGSDVKKIAEEVSKDIKDLTNGQADIKHITTGQEDRLRKLEAVG